MEQVFDEGGPDPAGQSLFLLSCCWGVSGTSYCLISSFRRNDTWQAVPAWQLVSEKQCLSLDLLCSAERKSFVRLCKGISWHLKSSFVVPFRAEVSIFDSSSCWCPALIPVIPIAASQIQEHFASSFVVALQNSHISGLRNVFFCSWKITYEYGTLNKSIVSHFSRRTLSCVALCVSTSQRATVNSSSSFSPLTAEFIKAVTVIMLTTKQKGEVLCTGNKQKPLLDCMSWNKCWASSFLSSSY